MTIAALFVLPPMWSLKVGGLLTRVKKEKCTFGGLNGRSLHTGGLTEDKFGCMQ